MWLPPALLSPCPFLYFASSVEESCRLCHLHRARWLRREHLRQETLDLRRLDSYSRYCSHSPKYNAYSQHSGAKDK